jgi:hypothetical protein
MQVSAKAGSTVYSSQSIDTVYSTYIVKYLILRHKYSFIYKQSLKIHPNKIINMRVKQNISCIQDIKYFPYM